jgi:ubiquinone/menaquinone biosynthesis C-methylase UbiE
MVRGDALTLDLGTSAFDSIIVAFLLSHLTPQQQSGLIGSLARALRRGGRLLILDSAWSEARARVRSRVSEQERVVADGRSFRLHKRYFTGDELSDLAIRRGLTPRGEHAGDVFLAVSMSAGG